MAKETVQTIRKAEIAAVDAEREALKKKEAILLEAQQKARDMAAAMVNGAQDKAQKEYDKAIEKGKAMTEAARLGAEKEIAVLKEIVKSKEQTAIDLVISTVV
jgi:V/A-type H+-transporting ATPase subunit G/H